MGDGQQIIEENMSKIDAIILAGAPAGPELSPDDAQKSRAMIKLGDKTMRPGSWTRCGARHRWAGSRRWAMSRRMGSDSAIEPVASEATSSSVSIGWTPRTAC